MPDGIPATRQADEAIRAHVGRVNAGKERTLDLLLIALLELLAHLCQPAVADYCFFGGAADTSAGTDRRNSLFSKDVASVYVGASGHQRADVGDGCM